VLGCLVEKARLTTPQPVSADHERVTPGLQRQATNRDPIMTFDDGMVGGALEELKALRPGSLRGCIPREVG